MGLPASRIQQFNQSENVGIRAGGAVLGEAREVLPAFRKCQDVIWAALFLIPFIWLPYFALTESKGWSFHGEDLNADAKKVGVKAVLVAMGTSAAAACLLAVLFLVLARHFTKVMIWVSLLFTPAVLLINAACFIVFPEIYRFDSQNTRYIAALCLAIPALLMLTCYICCWRRMVDFTAKILYAVAGVFQQHLGLCIVALVCLVCCVTWAIFWSTAVVVLSDKLMKAQDACKTNQTGDRCHEQAKFYGFFALMFLIFAWCVTVFQNVAHTTNCGVFGRWYFQQPASVCRSLSVSLTTSFGSICLGSLIVAFISALEATLRQIRRQTGRDNTALMVLLCVLDCIVSCIRDYVEAFSYFAYVQCAIRGLSFWSSAKATYALCKWDNIYALVATTVVDNVCAMGSIMCGIIAAAAGSFVGSRFITGGTRDEINSMCVVNFISAFLIGTVIASTILTVLRSGFATIVVCWAENKEALQSLQRDLYQDFNHRSQVLL
jgi:hypothetical protein